MANHVSWANHQITKITHAPTPHDDHARDQSCPAPRLTRHARAPRDDDARTPLLIATTSGGLALLLVARPHLLACAWPSVQVAVLRRHTATPAPIDDVARPPLLLVAWPSCPATPRGDTAAALYRDCRLALLPGFGSATSGARSCLSVHQWIFGHLSLMFLTGRQTYL